MVFFGALIAGFILIVPSLYLWDKMEEGPNLKGKVIRWLKVIVIITGVTFVLWWLFFNCIFKTYEVGIFYYNDVVNDNDLEKCIIDSAESKVFLA